MFKTCTLCNTSKPINDFVVRKNRKSGRQPYCKQCHNKKMREDYNPEAMKNYDLKKSYGITYDDYNKMFLEQNGCCAICDTHITDINHKHKKHLCIDHNHETGKVRGLLCDSCNRGIGLLKDNYKILIKAANYLKSNDE